MDYSTSRVISKPSFILPASGSNVPLFLSWQYVEELEREGWKRATESNTCRAGQDRSVKYNRRDVNKVTHRVIGEMRPSLLLDTTGKGSAHGRG